MTVNSPSLTRFFLSVRLPHLEAVLPAPFPHPFTSTTSSLPLSLSICSRFSRLSRFSRSSAPTLLTPSLSSSVFPLTTFAFSLYLCRSPIFLSLFLCQFTLRALRAMADEVRARTPFLISCRAHRHHCATLTFFLSFYHGSLLSIMHTGRRPTHSWRLYRL